ncbi:MAG: glycosyltransferase family 4 protein [Oligoflexia bacterium]|nr:glycosyltransferase family 4 protein [Oligoflexia bacterium]
MRILGCYYTHKPGGFCKRLYRLLQAAARAGHQVHYATLDAPPVAQEPNLHTHIIPFPLSTRRGVFFWTLFTFWAPCYLLILALRLRPQRLLAFGAFYASVLAPSRFLMRIPLVLFLRSLVFKINAVNSRSALAQACSNLIDRFGIAAASSIVCMTQAMRKELVSFCGRPLGNIKILPNDLPTAPANISPLSFGVNESKIGPHTLIVTTSGVLDKRKNVSCAISACAAFSKDGQPQDLLLVIAGEGPERAGYENACLVHGTQNIIFLGWCDSLWALYQRTHIVIHPALHEGMSNSLLEALALNLPVLAADTPENREMLKSSALLFDPQSPSELELRLKNFRNNFDQRESLVTLARQVASTYRFDWDAAAVKCVVD